MATSNLQPVPEAQSWCPRCGALHEDEPGCARDLRATGLERHGWRVCVDTPRGLAVVGVLVAPAGPLWRARVLTYPDRLWRVGEDGPTLKFLGASPQEAESRAATHVETMCRAQGLREHAVLPPLEPAQVEPESVRGAPFLARKLRVLPVWFGHRFLSREAETDNLSESGLFVRTNAPFEPGRPVLLRLQGGRRRFDLHGVVVWSRLEPEKGRPEGMGVRLCGPPAAYRRFVAGLP